MLPSPSDLGYFLEVASAHNLSRAAERLGISQPSLTLAIQRLENNVGTRLLNRSRQGVDLTQAGKQLLIHARHLLQDWEQTKTATLASENEIQGTFVVGCHPSVGLYSLPTILPGLLQEHPRLELRLKHELSRKITEGVISSAIDLGIVINPVRHPDLIITKMGQDEVCLWTHKKPIGALQDLESGEAVLIGDPELAQFQSILKQLRQQGFQVRRILETNSLELAAALTAEGAGIGILPSRVATAGFLKRVDPSPVLMDEICLLMRVENKGVCSLQALATALKAHFSVGPKR